MVILRNYIPHKPQKYDCKTPEWINKLITSTLKKDQYFPKDTTEILQNIAKKLLF